jgi:hypothetical protein
MNEAAAPRAAEGLRGSEALRQALEALQAEWDSTHIGGYDEHGYWAARRGQIGVLVRADTPGELRELLTADTGAAP